jgi:hypothetical protein
MCTFVLPGKTIVPADNRTDRIYFDAGKKLYTERQTEFKNNFAKADGQP